MIKSFQREKLGFKEKRFNFFKKINDNISTNSEIEDEKKEMTINLNAKLLIKEFLSNSSENEKKYHLK